MLYENLVIEKEDYFKINNKVIKYFITFNLNNGNRMGYLALPIKIYKKLQKNFDKLNIKREISFFEITNTHPRILNQKYVVIGFHTGSFLHIEGEDRPDIRTWKKYLFLYKDYISIEEFSFMYENLKKSMAFSNSGIYFNKKFWSMKDIQYELEKLASQIIEIIWNKKFHQS